MDTPAQDVDEEPAPFGFFDRLRHAAAGVFGHHLDDEDPADDPDRDDQG